MIEQVCIEVLSTQMGISSGRLHGENTTLNVQKRHVERTSAEVVDQDIALFVGLARAETVCNGSCGRFVDDAENVETGNRTGILSSLSLVIVEVGRNGDDGLGHLLPKLC